MSEHNIYSMTLQTKQFVGRCYKGNTNLFDGADVVNFFACF